MKNTLIFLGLCLLPYGTAIAQEPHVFRNPCERGLLPKVGTINEVNQQFVNYLTEIRPNLPRATAELIGYQLCQDLSLVNDSAGLTRRLTSLLATYGELHSK